MNRQQILLAIVAALLVVRFLLYPGFAILEELEAEVDTLSARYQKGESMLNSAEQLDKTLAEVNQLLGAQKSEFPSYQSQKAATLQIQKRLDELAEQHDVTFESQEWVSHIEGLPMISTMELKVDANLEDFVGFQTSLENLGEGITTSQVRLQIKKQILRQKRLGDVSGTMVYQFYYVAEGNNG